MPTQRRPHTGSIWDLDPRDARADVAYEDYEAIFIRAFLHAFGRLPSRARAAGYLQRYFRFGVVPRWVSSYIREQCHGISIANLAEAPPDPQFDVLLALERSWRRRRDEPRGVLFA
jgi:AraC-like DNA-binding protein